MCLTCAIFVCETLTYSMLDLFYVNRTLWSHHTFQCENEISFCKKKEENSNFSKWTLSHRANVWNHSLYGRSMCPWVSAMSMLKWCLKLKAFSFDVSGYSMVSLSLCECECLSTVYRFTVYTFLYNPYNEPLGTNFIGYGRGIYFA